MRVRPLLLIALAALALLVAGSGAEAKSQSFTIDSVHSTVIFRVKHLGAAWAYGRFNEVSGSFAFDEEKPEGCALDLEIDAASVDTNNEDRDKHLRGEEFFNTEKFPSITLVSKKIAKVAEGTYELTADLTLLAETKEITVRLTKTGEAKHERFGHKIGFDTTFTIKRSDYGMKAMLDLLGDEVLVMVAIEGNAT
jgi:polyisoprenoid-binding protein YceI